MAGTDERLRLRGFDERSATLGHVCDVLRKLWFITFGTALTLSVAWGILVHHIGIELVSADGRLSLAGATMGAASSLGGLAATLFFLTAQLRVSGISQHGVSDVYEPRLIAPLLISTSTLMIDSAALFVTATGESAIAEIFTWVALSQLVPFLLAVIHLALLTLFYFDPVAVGRRFTQNLRASDTEEWQLLHLTVATADASSSEEPLLIQATVRSNRMNFGLRDPLMSIQELVEKAQNKQFGRLVGLVLERISLEYGITWAVQAPDPQDWVDEDLSDSYVNFRTLSRKRRQVITGCQTGKPVQDIDADGLTHATQRISLVLLALHWCRRLPGNDRIRHLPLDVRRQQVQFLICRLALLMTRLQPKQSQAPSLREREVRSVVVLCVYAVAGLSGQFRGAKRSGKIEPAWALFAVAQAMLERNWQPELRLVLETLVWLHRRTPHINNSWKAAFGGSMEGHPQAAEVLRRLDALNRRSVLISDSYPTLDPDRIQDPWQPWSRARKDQ